MPDQTPLSPKIEDLKARIRLDPKSRLFLPLAEELRKSGRPEEAEKVLRDGLEHHSTYLSAWISLGRCLIEKGERREAIPVLLNALSIDPGNVVAARLLADNYLALGEKVEAIKKLKLVRALLPTDNTVQEAIEALELELRGEVPLEAAAAGEAVTEPGDSAPAETAPAALQSEEAVAEEPPEEPLLEAEMTTAAEPEPESMFLMPAEAAAEEPELPRSSEPSEPPPPPPETQIAASRPFFMADEPDEEEEIEAGVEAADETDQAPLEAAPAEDEAAAFVEPEGEVDPFSLDSAEPFAGGDEALPEPMYLSDEPEEPVPAAVPIDEQTSTLTMADLYARQGHVEAAREIYQRILDRNPDDTAVRQKLDLLGAVTPASQPPAAGRVAAVQKLEKWLQKVGPR